MSCCSATTLFLEFSLSVKMVLECQRILGEKNTNVPRRHPVVFGFRFSFLCGLLCVMYRCWGTFLVCVLGLLFIFKGEAIFFVAKLSSNSDGIKIQ